MFDLVIRGDRVVTPQGVDAYDIAVQGKKIVAVAPRHPAIVSTSRFPRNGRLSVFGEDPRDLRGLTRPRQSQHEQDARLLWAEIVGGDETEGVEFPAAGDAPVSGAGRAHHDRFPGRR